MPASTDLFAISKQHEALLTRSLHILEIALNPIVQLADSRFDYGFIHAIAPHCLVITVEEGEDGDEISCNPHVAEDGQSILLSGWVTGLVLGCDFKGDVAGITTISGVQDGIWLELSSEIPTQDQEHYDGALVQLPHAKLLNPTSLKN